MSSISKSNLIMDNAHGPKVWLCAKFYLLTAHLCTLTCFLSFITVYRFFSINHTCVLNKKQVKCGVYSTPPKPLFLDLSFYYFILGTIFPFANLFVSVSFLLSHQIHTKLFHKPAVSGFGIREYSIKVKSMFLLPYVSMNVLALSEEISISVQYQ